MTNTKEKKVTYGDVIYLNNILNVLNITKIDKSLRPDFLKIKKNVDLAAEDLIEQKTFILIMEGGIQITNQDNSKSYDEPPFVSRKDCEDDDEFKTKNEKIKVIRQRIKKELSKLLNTESNLTIVPFMTEKQFDEIHDLIKSIDFEKTREYFVIK